MAPRKREPSKPRPFTFSMVVDDRLEELLMITILAPVCAIFSTGKIETKETLVDKTQHRI